MADSIACHRCGHMLDGEPAFCPHCGAPQIRVPLQEEEVSAEVAPASPVPPSHRIQWSRAFMAVFMPAVMATALILIPVLNFAAMFWIAAAGFVSVRLYRRRAQSAVVNTATGTKLGAAVGVLCGLFICILLSLGFAMLAASGGSVRQAMLDQLHSNAVNVNPRTQAMLEQIANNPQILVPAMALSLVLFVVCGTIGGALAGASEARRTPPR